MSWTDTILGTSRALFKDCIGLLRVFERLPELSAASEAAITAGDQNLQCVFLTWARCASSNSTTKTVCELSAADQSEVLHVSVSCTAG